MADNKFPLTGISSVALHAAGNENAEYSHLTPIYATSTFTFDTATKKLRSIDVATYLDSPKDTVTVTARFSSLADGTNFLEESVLDASAKEIQIKTTNSGHSKAGG